MPLKNVFSDPSQDNGVFDQAVAKTFKSAALLMLFVSTIEVFLYLFKSTKLESSSFVIALSSSWVGIAALRILLGKEQTRSAALFFAILASVVGFYAAAATSFAFPLAFVCLLIATLFALAAWRFACK
jgi:catabolite regulation protein CreA